jgi:hypothetical protein
MTKTKFRQILFVALLAMPMSCMGATALADVKAFPQAEGFGAEVTGGRNGVVYHVTSLADTNTNGTLRYGLSSFSPSTPVTIVFDVGGWINLGSNLGVTRSNITIAGQTAPGGIGVRGGKFSVGGDNIAVRHMRFKPGKGSGRNDSVNVNENAQGVIFDHVSAGFSWDENFSVQATDVTLQYSTVSFGLEDHSAGSLLENPHRLSMHHNLYAHNHTRNPKHRVHETLDWVNNVVYDYDIGFNMDGTDSPGYFWTANFDGNYYVTGPGKVGTNMMSGGEADDYGLYFGTNYYDGDGDAIHDGVELTRSSRDLLQHISVAVTFSNTPYPVANTIWRESTIEDTYQRVLNEFGATPWDRDEVDQLLHNDVVNRTGAIIDHENKLVARGVSNGGFGTLGGVAKPQDSDNDGMPDAWEIKHGTNPARLSANADFDSDGYSDLEEYLNQLAAFKAAGSIELVSAGRYANPENWLRRWEPSRFDEVHIDATATVDAVGQYAGLVKIGTEVKDGADGVLNVASGWLEVTDGVEIGANPNSDANLNLTGGSLSTGYLRKSADGEFNFTGGVLSADAIDFDLEVNGGTLSPGSSPGTTHVQGDATFNSGMLLLEIAGADTGEYDKLIVDGILKAGGTLKIAAIDGYVPGEGDTFDFFDFASMMGQFAFELPALPDGLHWDESLLRSHGSLQVAAIPEPESIWFAIVCLASAFAARSTRNVRDVHRQAPRKQNGTFCRKNRSAKSVSLQA